jgi:hypothetical protein
MRFALLKPIPIYIRLWHNCTVHWWTIVIAILGFVAAALTSIWASLLMHPESLLHKISDKRIPRRG